MSTRPPELQPLGFDALVREAVARIPISTPEWTTRSAGDPGLTLIELFAFLMESVSFGVNAVPERNRATFLRLLGVPRAAGAPATGLVTFTTPAVRLLDEGLELRAGKVPFTTEAAVQALPVEAHVVVKRRAPAPEGEALRAYRRLYAALGVSSTPGTGPALEFYDTVTPDPAGPGTLLADTVDGAVWMALLLPRDRRASTPEGWEALRAEARRELATATLSLGLVPVVPGEAAAAPGLTPGRAAVEVAVPAPAADGTLNSPGAGRTPAYRTLPVRHDTDVTRVPGVVEVSLPGDPAALALWTDIEPVEEGAGALPPALDPPALADRVVTWLRLRGVGGALAGVVWTGVNAVPVTQRVRVVAEPLPDGTGEADQEAVLSRPPVVPGSVALTVTRGEVAAVWSETDDLLAAGAEIGAGADRRTPGAAPARPRPAEVFTCDPASGTLRFGDGLRGARPPEGARLVADYDTSEGAEGNVPAGAIAAGAGLPTGVTVINPVRTWGGADPDGVPEWERQAARFLRHRERLVTVDDIVAITRTTPAVDVARVEVLPAWRPGDATRLPGDAPGAVTVMVVPRAGEGGPEWPVPGPDVLSAVCAHLEPRRIVTTELVVRGPEYVPLWVSAGVETEPGEARAAVHDRVRAAVRRFLAAVDPEAPPWYHEAPAGLAGPFVHPEGGWPLATAVQTLELVAVASRVPGVRLVRRILLADEAGAVHETLPMAGLQLPRLLGVAVADPDPVPIEALRGAVAADAGAALPVPRVPEVC